MKPESSQVRKVLSAYGGLRLIRGRIEGIIAQDMGFSTYRLVGSEGADGRPVRMLGPDTPELLGRCAKKAQLRIRPARAGGYTACLVSGTSAFAPSRGLYFTLSVEFATLLSDLCTVGFLERNSSGDIRFFLSLVSASTHERAYENRRRLIVVEVPVRETEKLVPGSPEYAEFVKQTLAKGGKVLRVGGRAPLAICEWCSLPIFDGDRYAHSEDSGYCCQQCCSAANAEATQP